ncbi:MAG: helix-hairpin-helix domain-containing protein [Phycisphaerae bacterium]|nr:helix-hairpin-helix domain-containing protein [Phycisphaerae bacterium]
MIARLSGLLEELSGGGALIATAGGLWYEVLLPAADIERLGGRVGKEVVLHTIHYLEGDPSHGAQTPRLIGFVTPEARAFFRLFTTVKGIGNRKALRALAKPVGEIAAAIAAKDSRFLTQLPEIGKRTAEQIIAELAGKVEPFVTSGTTMAAAAALSEAASEAVSVLVQLGERRADALALVDRVMAVAPELDSVEVILQQVYKLRAT